jgi:hypothetical protein
LLSSRPSVSVLLPHHGCHFVHCLFLTSLSFVWNNFAIYRPSQLFQNVKLLLLLLLLLVGSCE